MWFLKIQELLLWLKADVNTRRKNASIAERWRKFKDIWCLCYWSLQKKKWFSIHSERNLTAIWDMVSFRGHVLKILEHNKITTVYQWLWAKCVLSTDFTNFHSTFMTYMLLRHFNRWGKMILKCLRQGHLANMDLNPGLWH